MASSVRISALLWADILVAYALFVMQNYLTGVWKLSFTHSAGILNIWGGISMILPFFFLYLVDTVLGNFGMLVISSISYSVGIAFVTMSTPPVLANSTNTCKKYEPQCIGHTQKVLFYTCMALIAVGVAGNHVSVKTYLDEQNPESGKDKARGENPLVDCLRIPGLVLVVVMPIVGAISLPYIKPWSLRFGIPAICTVVATLLFLSGCCCIPFKKPKPQGSPITNICRVFVAAAYKIPQRRPDDARQLYTDNKNELEFFTRTRLLRGLEKAAIILPEQSLEDQKMNRWTLCSVSEVEEAKIAVRMVPMWSTFIICGIVSSIGNTYFVEQSSKMNRHIGKWELPPQILLLLHKSAKQIFDCLEDLRLKNGNRTAPAFGIGTAMMFSVVCCLAAAGVEKRRLNVIRSHGLLDKPDEHIPMSIFWLVFQYILLAGLDSYLGKSVAKFHEDQSPESMKKYLKHLTKAVSGLGFMFSVVTVIVVGKISEKGGKSNWFQHTLNKSRLDRYYWVLAGLSSVNLLVFVLVAINYSYKTRGYENREAPAPEEAMVDTGGSGLYTDQNKDS